MKLNYKYGLITGLSVGIFTIAFFSIGVWLNTTYNWGMHADNIRGIGGLLTLLILGTGIYLSMQSVKKDQNGFLSYRQAVKAGIIVAIITALITALAGFIYCEFINPGFAAYMVNEAKKTMMADGESSKQIAGHLVGVSKEFGTGMQVIMALTGQSVVGTIISLIMSIFLKSKKRYIS